MDTFPKPSLRQEGGGGVELKPAKTTTIIDHHIIHISTGCFFLGKTSSPREFLGKIRNYQGCFAHQNCNACNYPTTNSSNRIQPAIHSRIQNTMFFFALLFTRLFFFVFSHPPRHIINWAHRSSLWHVLRHICQSWGERSSPLPDAS